MKENLRIIQELMKSRDVELTQFLEKTANEVFIFLFVIYLLFIIYYLFIY